MPDSLPQSAPLHAANGDSFPVKADHSTTVSANTQKADRNCLAAPPRDVGRMLERYGTALPRYLDAHRLVQIQSSHQRWPLLRPMGAANEGSKS